MSEGDPDNSLTDRTHAIVDKKIITWVHFGYHDTAVRLKTLVLYCNKSKFVIDSGKKKLNTFFRLEVIPAFIYCLKTTIVGKQVPLHLTRHLLHYIKVLLDF